MQEVREQIAAMEKAGERDYAKLRELEKQREEAARLAEEKRAKELAARRAVEAAQAELADALASKDIDRLAAAIEAAEPLEVRNLKKPRAALEKLREEKAARASAAAALAKSRKRQSIFSLGNAIAAAEAVDVDASEDAALLAKLEADQAAVDEKVKDLLAREDAAAAAEDYDLAEALAKERKALPRTAVARRAFEAIDEAIEQRSSAALEAAIAAAKKHNEAEAKDEHKVSIDAAALKVLLEEVRKEEEQKAKAEAEAKAAAAAKKKKEKEERERAEVERKAAAEALKTTQQGATLAPSEARAAARAALGAQEQSHLDEAVYDECYDESKGNRGKVKGMLDRGADPNGYKVRRT